MSDLDRRLLIAHDRGDGEALVSLYTEAAEHAQTETMCAFYLTHAMVLALEFGNPTAATLRDRLVGMGREEPL
ncbi:hypothetical protein AB1M95_07030 [Sulfitobacter sp. LCG007]